MADEAVIQEHRPGVAIDSRGSPVIDPTKNVEDLVRALEVSATKIREADQRFLDAQLIAFEKLQDFARAAESKFQNFARDAESKFQTALRESETRHNGDMSLSSQRYLDTIKDMLAESVRTTSTLVSTQLVQIQATFDTRVSKLEATAFTQAGRSSVADPAMEGTLRIITNSIASLSSRQDDALSKFTQAISELRDSDHTRSGKDTGRQDISARMIAVVAIGAAIFMPLLIVMLTKLTH